MRRTDYAHDKGGNRTSVAYRALPGDANPVSSDTYTRTAGTNRLASITTPAGTRSISYDARGNTASETRPAGVSVSTSYDGYGRLTAYTRTGDPTQTNAYNGLDDRVAVTSGGTTRRYVFDADGRVMGEYGTSASDVIAEFIWLNPEVGDGSAFGGDDGVGGYAPLAVASGPVATPTLLWVHGNHLGVPQVYTTSSGTITAPGAWQLPGFPGQSRTLADLYYNRHRDYDPSTGRYIQADPIGLDGDTNPYVYALNNPMTGIDPLGLVNRSLIATDSWSDRATVVADGTFDPSDVYTVSAHGNRSGFGRDKLPRKNGKFDIEGFLNDIRRHGWDGKQSIVLLACNVGNGPIPGQIARRAGVPVIAATGYVKPGIGVQRVVTKQGRANGGQFKSFRPNGTTSTQIFGASAGQAVVGLGISGGGKSGLPVTIRSVTVPQNSLRSPED